MRPHPHLYEVNALIFLRRLSRQYGRQLTLSSIPEEEWKRLRRQGFDLVWLMGVWQRSPGGRKVALGHPGLRSDYAQALPAWTEDDVVGSPYAVYTYDLDTRLGEDGELLELKAALHRHGLGLVLDFVPNHLALDHPWTLAHPRRFVRGSPESVSAHPEWFFPTAAGANLAHGRDPYFPPWTDTAQVNFFWEELRVAWVEQLLRIAEVADGVRCDMAMLGLNRVFENVWGQVIGGKSRPGSEFWSDAIREVKQRHPGFIFIAEAYWELEPELLALGFDYAYDKALYDKLRSSSAADIQQLLASGRRPHYVRFIENHDEPRAITAFGRERSLASSLVMATLPGLRLFHDGQMEGKRVHLPVQLGREPEETPDAEIQEFYRRLLSITNTASFHEGEWGLLKADPAWEGNPSYQNLLAWTWNLDEQWKIVVVNFAPTNSQGRVKLPPISNLESVTLRDGLRDVEYVRDVAELQSPGLYVELGPWQAHVLGKV